jgi:hypothetical protein
MKSLNLNRKLLPEQLELAMRFPEIANPVSPLRRGLAPCLRPHIAFSPTEKLSPNPAWPEHCFEVRLPAIRRPKSAISDEPQPVLSPRRSLALRLGNDLVRHMPRSFLIPRKMHRVLGASLRR